MELTAGLVVLGQAIGTVGFGWIYFRRWHVTRPPIGVFDLSDVVFLLGAIVLIPILYLALPIWLLAGLLATGALSAMYAALEPILRARRARGLLVVVALVGEVATLHSSGPTSSGYFVVNNAVVVIGVVGVANLWAQSGMRARDAAIVGAALAVYDVVFTSALPLMSELFDQVSRQPFAPMVGWPASPDGRWIGLGLGDLLVLTVFPLVMRKAYGGRAGRAALIINSALLSAIVTHTLVANVRIFPVMAAIGPAMALQYAWWSRRLGPERTTRDYLAAEPTTGLDKRESIAARDLGRLAPAEGLDNGE